MKRNETNFCSKCFRAVKFGDGPKGADEHCQHYTHYHCLDKQHPNFLQCCQCRGCGPTLPIKERSMIAGHDYVAEPMWKEYDYNVMEPILLSHPSIERLVFGEELHLQDLLYYGVNINVLLEERYDWKDLVKFQDLSKPGQRRIDALCALQCTAEHFRDYPTELPAKEMGVTPYHLVTAFGLHFGTKEHDYLATKCGKNSRPWTLSQLIALDVSADELFAAGLFSLAQLENLSPTDEELERADFRQHQVDNLYPPKVHPTVKPKPPQTPKKKREIQEAMELNIMSANFSNVYIKPPRKGLKQRK